MNDDGATEKYVPILMGTFFLLLTFVVAMVFARAKGAPSKTPADDYQEALYETMSPDQKFVDNKLYQFDHSATFVTWTQQKYVSFFKKKNPTDQPKAGTDIWVAPARDLQRFCKDFVSKHGADPDKLDLRLKQRLGLPPESNNDTFVELSLDPNDKGGFFRPCGDLSSKLGGNTCQPPQSLPRENSVWNGADPSSKSSIQQEWILRKYYSSFASSPQYPRASQYPWTALGYTFDWARSEDGGTTFVRFGESEFVIPKGDPVHYVSDTPTLAWCTPD